MKNSLLVFLALICATSVFAQDNARQIKGKLMYLDAPLANAEIKVSGSDELVKTNMEGQYAIEAETGDILLFSYPGMRTTELVVEDVTTVLNLNMMPEINELDEVVVEKTVIKSQKQMQAEYATNKSLVNTAFGILDKETTSFAVRILEGEDLNNIGIDIASAIQFKFPGVRVDRIGLNPDDIVVYLRGGPQGFFPAIYDVDGLVMTDFPGFIQIDNIERIALIPGLGAVTKYGGQANGGVIIINTKTGNYFPEPGTDGMPYDQAKLRNNIFKNDAISKNEVSKSNPTYLNKILASSTEAEAIDTYNEQIKAYGNSYFYVLDAYDYFANKWKNTEFADEIIQTNYRVFESNPVALKALAYHYEVDGNNEKAHELYKKVFTMRPSYSQSYMDLANSYRAMGENQKAAGIYARYGYLLEEGFIKSDSELGLIVEREFNNLIALKGKELLSKRELKKYVLDDEFDGTRLVFEWSDSEAEFELQFVNPEGNYFKSEHSLLADASRIKNEKLSGFSSEEYLIDDSLRGVWQVNAKYLGNKSLTPTYLKTTVYHNYGTASQREEIKLFKLGLKNINQQLFTVSNASSVVSN